MKETLDMIINLNSKLMSENDKFINLDAVRRDDQKKVMQDIKEADHCPFCAENLKKYHKNPILKESKYWVLTDNQWPYEKIKNQLLAIYKEHIEHLTEMDDEAGKELIDLFKEIAKNRNIPGGAIAIRFGSNEKGNYGNSVKHLHAHLVEPDLDQMENNESWKFKMGKKN